jgi:hypothetical protein
MAAPSAAGIALLVRQYFADSAHKFWLAVCKSTYLFCKSFQPSGMLNKAILLHSGSQMAIFNAAAAGGIGRSNTDTCEYINLFRNRVV